MIDFPRYNFPEVVDHDHLAAWRASLPKVNIDLIPDEVKSFIEAIALKLDDFGRIRDFYEDYSGFDLLLTKMTHFKGEIIDKWSIYPMAVPYRVAVDNRTTMFKLFKRKGKQGLVDYCKARVKGTELEGLLHQMNIHVFHEYTPEFKRVMAEINASKKITEL